MERKDQEKVVAKVSTEPILHLPIPTQEDVVGRAVLVVGAITRLIRSVKTRRVQTVSL